MKLQVIDFTNQSNLNHDVAVRDIEKRLATTLSPVMQDETDAVITFQMMFDLLAHIYTSQDVVIGKYVACMNGILYRPYVSILCRDTNTNYRAVFGPKGIETEVANINAKREGHFERVSTSITVEYVRVATVATLIEAMFTDMPGYEYMCEQAQLLMRSMNSITYLNYFNIKVTVDICMEPRRNNDGAEINAEHYNG
ncbi:MAG: hypothetical protein ACRDDY_14145 [Clostridium sp.]|uniref:hypothetical protein n=1 Tax=Clostridium sp. TaxID=1506 RepID=UPI003EE4C5C7